jgi:(1->4)-alpha-D-glucan 1-alpha-D-glucosylmutase
VALNEVGGNPDQFGLTIPAFHKANVYRVKNWPHAMLATSTHDTKRGEDVRARLAVLTEIPEEWSYQVNAWSRVLHARMSDVEGTAPPYPNDEYLLYQLMVGSWPAELTLPNSLNADLMRGYAGRLKGAMIKSLREAKVQSSWAAPDMAYEQAVLAFIDDALDPERSSTFLAIFLPFQERVARLGVSNSLAQTVLKFTSPGMPDLYQGAELWDLSLMDPDNRRAVDYSLREDRLARLEETACLRQLVENWHDGTIKLAVTARLLALRKRHTALFLDGGYEPLLCEGARADHVCAFQRDDGSSCVVVAVTRLPAALENDPDWRDTILTAPTQYPESGWRDVLSGRHSQGLHWPVDVVFSDCPVVVLERM